MYFQPLNVLSFKPGVVSNVTLRGSCTFRDPVFPTFVWSFDSTCYPTHFKHKATVKETVTRTFICNVMIIVNTVFHPDITAYPSNHLLKPIFSSRATDCMRARARARACVCMRVCMCKWV